MCRIPGRVRLCQPPGGTGTTTAHGQTHTAVDADAGTGIT
eukprot:CAMPEP_0182583238 /NCGR_PEP_ID=MMETSP1324-20130603/54575_1 /TAXON_ID=236786 /ORGANISM="Florenciella sp., Strain RCC1587" /LENGTH=39 /DNA_ID= /DNA_START= /DNA_END= /DNA_ORIENTATION=